MHRAFVLLSSIVLASACTGESPTKSPDSEKHRATPRPAAAVPLPDLDWINHAGPVEAPKATGNGPPIPFVIHAEVLLARARFSPGVVDGQFGSNFKHAVAAYQLARNLPVSGTVDDRTWQALAAEPASALPVARTYVLTAADITGPYGPDVGEDFAKLAALPNGPQFTNVVEAVAERFHMSQALLRAVNPAVNFAAAGVPIVVVDAAASAFAKGDVARVDVAKAQASVRAYDKADKLLAFYPATVGSAERPSPSGTHKVVGVAWNPTYTYDPAKLAWGPRAGGKLVIKPGPDNPVGTVWIDLDAPSYGLHGTPDPDAIGKTASHGCVRLTNWDAQALAAGVKPGVIVHFASHAASGD